MLSTSQEIVLRVLCPCRAKLWCRGVSRISVLLLLLLPAGVPFMCLHLIFNVIHFSLFFIFIFFIFHLQFSIFCVDETIIRVVDRWQVGSFS